jgi:hypothetical protein
MKVIQTTPVEIALRTLGDDERRKVGAWFDHLRNWETDSFIRQQSRKLDSEDNVYILKTTGDLWIFFRLEADQIVLLDLATTATLSSFGHLSGAGQ